MTNPFGKQIEEKINTENIRAIIFNSMIPENFMDYKWGDYVPHSIEGKALSNSFVIESRENAKKICKSYVCSLVKFFQEESKGLVESYKKIPSLVIYGPETSGKTVLATLVARTLAESSQQSIVFVDFMDLNAEMYTVLDFRSENFATMLDRYLTPDILIIDEIAKTKISPMLEPFLSALLRQRQSSGKVKITIITSKVEKKSMDTLVGNDVNRMLNKKRDFKEIIILAEPPNILESYDEAQYSTKKINSLLFDFMGKNPTIDRSISESQIRAILNNSLEYSPKKNRR